MSDFGRELARLMAARNVGVRELARTVPCNPGHISNLRSGSARPSLELADQLDAILEAGGRLAALAAETSPVVPGGDLGLIELARRAEASDLGSGTLEMLQQSADRLCRDYPVVDPRVLSDQARTRLGYVTGLLGKRVTLAQHRELLVVAGWLSALLACTLYDAGDPGAAETARRMTGQFGHHADHGELVAWSFEIASWYALVEGRFAQTVALCEGGLAHAGTSNATVQLTLQASRAYARMGDDRAGTMLTAGGAVLAKLPVPEHPEHHFVFDRDKYEFYTASIYTWLGSDDAAAEENALEVVARCHGPGGVIIWPTRLSTTLVNLGQIAGRRGDLDEAVAMGAESLRCGRRSAELLPRAAELERRLASRYGAEPLVSQYGELLRDEFRALPPGDARRLDEAVGHRLDGKELP
ncbi:MAG TPA: tetratricopeptide repeat protein [Streptosporangiaceae bacterium]|nr:tetratricopeptide repeat protein [Streptosporangiaceae bacterium]